MKVCKFPAFLLQILTNLVRESCQRTVPWQVLRRLVFMLVNSVLDAIGNVPLIQLKKMSSGNVFVKAEFLNPGGSIKDRVAKHIIEMAEKEGKLKQGMTIIEATSGNTGIGLTLVGVQKGYKVICVMPGRI